MDHGCELAVDGGLGRWTRAKADDEGDARHVGRQHRICSRRTIRILEGCEQTRVAAQDETVHERHRIVTGEAGHRPLQVTIDRTPVVVQAWREVGERPGGERDPGLVVSRVAVDEEVAGRHREHPDRLWPDDQFGQLEHGLVPSFRLTRMAALA